MNKNEKEDVQYIYDSLINMLNDIDWCESDIERLDSLNFCEGVIKQVLCLTIFNELRPVE